MLQADDHAVEQPAPPYPRPRFARERWSSLDGPWAFARTAAAATAADVAWTETILVPFAPEAPLSGIEAIAHDTPGDANRDAGARIALWYRREFEVPPEWAGQRVLLHFGAVDHDAQVWVNGHLVAAHEGGHTPFSADVTNQLAPGVQVVVVRAEDDPRDLEKPRGKQDWLPEPHAIWYPGSSGIWQSVWLEPVAERRVGRARFTPDLTTFSILAEVSIAGDPAGLDLELSMTLDGAILAHDVMALTGPSLRRRIDLPDPGIFDARKAYLWSPEQPNLIDVQMRLRRGDEVLDEVTSYTALREVALRDGDFLLNGRPYFLRLALDQGYWRDGLMTAPTPDALQRDVELAKALGFNGVRKHQKVEDPRYLYWADRLGLLVWAELPSAYAHTRQAIARLTRTWIEMIERDADHPCIVTWVAFNESWGVPDLPTSASQRDTVRALYALAKALDPTRPVVGNDGWEFVAGDVFTIHDYDADPATLIARYRDARAVAQTVAEFRPVGRRLTTDAPDTGGRPVVLSEFGGIRFSQEADGWGYSQVASADALVVAYRDLVRGASGAGLAGFCYTQLTDTFQEQNGLLTMDRTPKADLATLATATRQTGTQ